MANKKVNLSVGRGEKLPVSKGAGLTAKLINVYCANCNISYQKKNEHLERWSGLCRSCSTKQQIKKYGNTHSPKTHGETGTRLYNIWCGIKKRCYKPSHKSYVVYGGRGISVCNEWLSYERFRDWALSNGYNNNLSIDRINNNGNYEPTNCRWASAKEQAQNRRNAYEIGKGKKLNIEQINNIRKYKKDGKSKKDLANQYGISISLIYKIINQHIWRQL